jgi:tRNA dimethylallyltransferase
VTDERTASPPLLVVAGATATGKTGLAIRLGQRILAEGRPVVVISADSRQVYRGLDIGTAKASPAERGSVLHAGLDLVDPPERFTVTDFVRHANGVLHDLAAQPDGVAILVGGTGLYLRAVARGLDVDDLPSDPALRATLEADLERDGPTALRGRLVVLAPALAATVDLANPRRVVRALELAMLRGDRPRPEPRGYGGPVAWIGLRVEDAEHRRRIIGRARAQFDAGLVDEAVALRERWDPTLPAFTAIGYAEAWSVADGTASLEAAIEADAARNVAFAKRQRTWFRAEPDIDWLDATDGDPDEAALTTLRGLLG